MPFWVIDKLADAYEETGEGSYLNDHGIRDLYFKNERKHKDACRQDEHASIPRVKFQRCEGVSHLLPSSVLGHTMLLGFASRMMTVQERPKGKG